VGHDDGEDKDYQGWWTDVCGVLVVNDVIDTV
jgi:hypothetical protein